MMSERVYVGSPLILKEFRDTNLAELIGDSLKLLGYEPYLPHLDTQHPDHSTLSDEEIYSKNMEAVSSSKFCIFEVTNPSHGVGMEIQKAVDSGLPILLFKSGDKRLSKMVSGVLSIEDKRRLIEYDDILDLHGKLKFLVPLYIDGSVVA